MDIDPVTQQRSTARRAYYDPYIERPNLWVTTDQTVTQILFDRRQMNQMASTPISGDFSVGNGGSPGIPTGIFGGTTTLNLTLPGGLQWLWRTFKRAILPRQSGRSPSTGLRAIGVEYAPFSGAARQTISASREVIVAAGALHSPQLLMLSGIGPAQAMQSLGIPVSIDLPGVGSNLQE
jgi:choline dehydrogenase